MIESIKVLIAEDDVDEQLFLQSSLEKHGVFKILKLLSNGRELVETLKSIDNASLPDLILSDINMPFVSGIEALVKVKKDTSLAKIPFVIFTTAKDPYIKEKALSSGADGFLIKPWSLNDYDDFSLNLKSIFDLRVTQ